MRCRPNASGECSIPCCEARAKELKGPANHPRYELRPASPVGSHPQAQRGSSGTTGRPNGALSRGHRRAAAAGDIAVLSSDNENAGVFDRNDGGGTPAISAAVGAFAIVGTRTGRLVAAQDATAWPKGPSDWLPTPSGATRWAQAPAAASVTEIP